MGANKINKQAGADLCQTKVQLVLTNLLGQTFFVLEFRIQNNSSSAQLELDLVLGNKIHVYEFNLACIKFI